ncbi:MAG TPA: ATP-binding protein [Accumulibacter sp.]|uniref:histidine kinase n=1 Tax=Candidatus Accumulibacter cognatus TaxID=2954383 RepID=A0A080M855_9PROT|nr:MULTISPECIES: ATP-binding protein [Candidatus Accumulibacter]MCC2866612.1 sensor histidine kinase N-terminal domain-containing protein [Candidatus Accumulibacter phosphatis]KFB77403.1 MAG: Sensor protein QseC [Candidatus Accumulibacter cognatus]MBN8516280.1 sensor histidine kinase N-terminal domain-containing protein [Accumulibacter sp.]MBO3711807.1 sensor histidine kinase N-terminal domain-containing protein [Accumulibacter sp.]MCM8580466.1 ATP-binding protein [Accumulibacter sp.]
MRSIRRQLLVTLLATITLTTLLGALATYRTALDEANALFDYQLRQLALSFRDQASQNAHMRDLAINDDAQDFSIQIWRPDGTRIYLSHPGKELPHLAPLGFATVDTGNGKWRVFGLQQGGQTIQVAQPLRVRDGLALAAALRTVEPFLLMLPMLGVLIWVVVGRGLRPLDAVARAMTTRTPVALGPLPTNGVPTEVAPLVRSLNDLLARLKRALDSQRDFIADAAHELRTPLAALSLQLQLARRAADAQSRGEAFGELERGLTRATHCVQQLLTLARQEPGGGDRPLMPVNLGDLVAKVVAEQLPLAEDRQIDLGVTPAARAVTVRGDAEALQILVSNLVGNAIRHTPSGGKVDVAVGDGADGVFVEVNDSGPGIPVEERERVFDRFYRRAQTDEPGSGLGLAIVRTIAERHQASVLLDEADLGGLRARVRFDGSPAS